MQRGGPAVQQHAVFPQRDQRGADALAQEHVAGPARIVRAGDGDAGEQRRLGLSGGDEIAQRIERVGHRLGRRRIEDGDHRSGAGDLETAQGGVDRLLELGDEDGSIANGLGSALDIGGRDGHGGAGHDDNGVLAGAIVDIDEGGPGRGAVAVAHSVDDAFLLPGGAGDAAELVAADLADEGDMRASAGGGNSLVRTLAAGPELEAGADHGFAHARQAAGTEGEIGNEAAEDGDTRLRHGQASPLRLLAMATLTMTRRDWQGGSGGQSRLLA
jgi:hypothetical protein